MPQKRSSPRAGRHPKPVHARPTVQSHKSSPGAAEGGTTFSLWDGQEVTITRRHFLYGAAGIAALGLMGGAGYAFDQLTASDEGDAVLDVPESAVFSTDDCTLIEDASSAMRLVSSRQLPYGSLVFASCDEVAACLLPTDTPSPLTQIGLITLGNGALSTIVPQALGASEGFDIFDARANDAGVAWVEAHVLKGLWRVYAAPLTGVDLGEPMLVAHGDDTRQMPTIAVAANSAFWQEMPQGTGKASDGTSRFMRARFGTQDAEELYTAPGAMASSPYASNDSVVITPRWAASTTHYQLTRLSADSGETLDSLVLPNAMKPLEAGFGPTGFAFAFDGIYNYGGGIANLGTYAPAALPGQDLTGAASAAAYDQAQWFRFARAPITAPAWCGPWLMVRSNSSVCGVDLSNRTYFDLGLENGAGDYGDQLASTGAGNRVVTFSNIDYTPLGGEHERHTLVRTWEAV